MEAYHEAFVAFDVAKLKHAVAEGDRSGEVRFLGEIENRPAVIEDRVPGRGVAARLRLWSPALAGLVRLPRRAA